MVKYLKLCLFVLTSAVFFSSTVSYAGLDAEEYYEIENFGEAMIGILEKLPYVKEGSGPIMFTFEFSECPYCQGMYRDYGNTTGLEHRRVFVPVSDRSAKEAAAMGKSRSIDDYHAFMTGRKRAPAFETDQASIDAYNSILDGVNAIEGILKQNGWTRQGLVYPQYVWVEKGKVFTSGGYEKAYVGRAIERAKNGGGTVDAWAKLTQWMNPAVAEAAPSKPKTSGGFDIVGVQIGMTKDEAVQALKEFDPRIKFQYETVKIVAPDSNKQLHDMGSYQNAIQAWLRHGIEGFNLMEEPTEKIVIYFSPPPAEQRVEFVGREMSYPTGKGPDFNLTMQSIANKYGTPTSKRDNNPGLVVQFWQERGPSLDGKQFIRYTNKSGILAPLNYKGGQYHSVGGQRPPVSEDSTGQSLGIMVNKGGQLVQMMRFMLADDKKTVEENRAATWDMGQAMLQKHEQKIKGAAQQRGGPRL